MFWHRRGIKILRKKLFTKKKGGKHWASSMFNHQTSLPIQCKAIIDSCSKPIMKV